MMKSFTLLTMLSAPAVLGQFFSMPIMKKFKKNGELVDVAPDFEEMDDTFVLQQSKPNEYWSYNSHSNIRSSFLSSLEQRKQPKYHVHKYILLWKHKR